MAHGAGKPGLPMTMQVEPAAETFRITIVYGRLPLPMKRADQMTVAHLIAFLKARGHEVDLLTLDDGEQLAPEHEAWLRAHCRTLTVMPQGRRRSLLGMMRGLARRLPLQVGWFSNDDQRDAVRRILAEGDVHHIRDLIDEHPHTIYIRADDPRGNDDRRSVIRTHGHRLRRPAEDRRGPR